MRKIFEAVAAEHEHSERLPAWWAFPVFLVFSVAGAVLTGMGLYIWDHSHDRWEAVFSIGLAVISLMGLIMFLGLVRDLIADLIRWLWEDPMPHSRGPRP